MQMITDVVEKWVREYPSNGCGCHQTVAVSAPWTAAGSWSALPR